MVRDENLPSTQWQTGRVIETHPGTDGLTRVVSLKTNGGILKRPIAKLCAFPNESNETEIPEITVKANIAKIRSVTPKRSIGTLPLITAILTLFTTVTNQTPLSPEPFVVSRFKSAPGFYFEKKSDVFMTHTDWNVIVHLNLNKLQDEYNAINENWVSAKEFCYRKALPNSGCRNVVSRLKTKIELMCA